MEIINSNLFPAYAGMNRQNNENRIESITVPRLCGDEPSHTAKHLEDVLCSPPMRG